MAVVRQAGALLLAALIMSRGLFAQDSAAVAPASPADQVKVLLRPTEIRYVQQESVLLPPTAKIKGRSEEHTSELQSRPHLVCRLLLEKKKNKEDKTRTSFSAR